MLAGLLRCGFGGKSCSLRKDVRSGTDSPGEGLDYLDGLRDCMGNR